MTYIEALNLLPADVTCTATFGNPGDGGYSEYWRSKVTGERWSVGNGSHLDTAPFNWIVKQITKS